MAYQAQLGLAPVVAALIVKEGPTLVHDVESLFSGSSYDATHQRILQWVNMIASDPTGALGPVTPGNNFTDTAADALLGLRCWAGDQSILSIYRQKSGDPAGNGCGCETEHGCRADAQAALAKVDTFLNRVQGAVSSADIPSSPTGQPVQPSGSIYTTLPGGISVGLPVPGMTILNSSIAGVPVWAIGAGIALMAFAGGSRRGR